MLIKHILVNIERLNEIAQLLFFPLRKENNGKEKKIGKKRGGKKRIKKNKKKGKQKEDQKPLQLADLEEAKKNAI